ncbi:MAG: ChaN family lipoprotein [Ottowia sp.]|uniref:ChaN family lipoprotein n=1 Tax=Ottowia sp. TaxID=1898956 RepID=UPI003C749BAF
MNPARRLAITWGAIVISSLSLIGCAHTSPPSKPAPDTSPWTAAEQLRLEALLPADAWLLGEQHDAPEHHELERQVVEWLARRGTLAAVAMEMAPRGKDTRGLSRDASASEVRKALDWNEAGWPWGTYGPVVMAAVQAGIPVMGANLPREQQRAAMQDGTLDKRLPPDALATQTERIRDSHCGLLPETQMRPMARVQVARDISMAQTTASALQPGRTVLLIAGNGHVDRTLGVPVHLPAGLNAKVISAQAGKQATATLSTVADVIWATPALPPKDYCAEMKRPAPPASSSQRQ